MDSNGCHLKYCSFVILLFSSNLLWAQSMLKGRIADTETDEALGGVHIGILNKKEGTVSLPDGSFSLAIAPGNTIYATMVGYHPEIVEVTQSLMNSGLIIKMTRKPVELNEVEIKAKKPLPVVVKPEETVFRMAPMGYKGPPKPIYPMSFHFDHPNENTVEDGMVPVFGPGGTLYGVFTYLFSKKEREKKRLSKIKRNEEHFTNYQELLIKALPDWLIKKALDVEKEDMEFIRSHFKFERDFLLNATEYEKILAIQKAYHKAQSQNN